jgi:hypothetical protein
MAVKYASKESLATVFSKLQGKIDAPRASALTAVKTSDLVKHFKVKHAGLVEGQYGHYVRMTTKDDKVLNISISPKVREEITMDEETIDTLFDNYVLWFGESKNDDGTTRPWLSFGREGSGELEFIAQKTFSAIAG